MAQIDHGTDEFLRMDGRRFEDIFFQALMSKSLRPHEWERTLVTASVTPSIKTEAVCDQDVIYGFTFKKRCIAFLYDADIESAWPSVCMMNGLGSVDSTPLMRHSLTQMQQMQHSHGELVIYQYKYCNKISED